ncbi:MAG: hypothetical protein PUE33_03770 [bacterium]|nr:hypothetical protein [Mycoplasmatota bacterium]MDD6757164.1 hypothetical protein [bacterium]MDY2908834.1 hypothetical protein [Candidatus Faecimonas sp.]
MKQRGFKAFNKNMENQYGIKFEEGKIYTIPEHIILTKGTKGTGFHYTPNLEDTLRYVDGMIEEIKIASVTASKEIISFDDEYNGYFDISAAREISIDHILSREEIMTYMLNRHSLAMKRFIQGFKLTPEEIKQIREKFNNDVAIDLAISYYQEKDKDAYKKFYKRKK